MAADTFSNTLGYLIMGTGNDNNSWGSNANAEVFQVFEDAIANVLTSTVTGGTLDLSGSPPPAAASQVRYAALVFNGTLGSAQTIVVPNLTKFWWVKNATAGAFTLKVKTTSGSASTAIPRNSGWQLIQCDAANNIIVSPFNSAQIEMPDGTVSAPAFSNINETNSGWYRAGTQDWRLSINGIDTLQITGAGAGTPSVMNLLVGSLQIGGVQPVPSGVVASYDGIVAPTGWIFVYGQALSRPIANGGSVDTYKGIWNSITAAVVGNTNGNTAITGLASDMRGLGLNKAFVEGTGIPTNTTITFTGATTGTLSQAAVGSHAGITLRFFPHGQGDASTTFNVRDGRDMTMIGRGDMNGTDRALVTVAGGNFDGTLLGTNRTAADIPGGAQSQTIGNSNLPASIPYTDIGHVHPLSTNPSGQLATGGGNGFGAGSFGLGGAVIGSTVLTSITINPGSANTALPNMQPAGVTNLIMKL